MRELMKKEFTLTAAPITFFFIAFAFMTMIPGYPILVGAFFICLGIFYSFQYAKDYNDILYTALLPIRKRDVVKTKFVFVVLIQISAFLINIIMTLIRMFLLNDAKPYVENPLMNANLIYLGYILVIFALFNMIFLIKYFKTTYYIGKPFVYYCVVAFVIIGIGETLHHVPGLTWLNTTDATNILEQSIFFLIGIIIYVTGTFFALKKSIRYFEMLDL